MEAVRADQILLCMENFTVIKPVKTKADELLDQVAQIIGELQKQHNRGEHIPNQNINSTTTILLGLFFEAEKHGREGRYWSKQSHALNMIPKIKAWNL